MRYLAVAGAVLLFGIVFGVAAALHGSGGNPPLALAPPASDAATPPSVRPSTVPNLAAAPAFPSIPVVASAVPATAAATATPIVAAPNPAPKPSSYAPGRLIIPSLGVNSSWIPLGWLPNGITMDSPPGPEDLGWYTFTAQPGDSSNAVFAGHVDWHTGAPALFAHLSDLRPGAEIDVSRTDGRLVVYHVVSSAWYGLYDTPAAPIIAASSMPEVTLITCGGDFNPATHEYDQRLIVRAIADGL